MKLRAVPLLILAAALSGPAFGAEATNPDAATLKPLVAGLPAAAQGAILADPAGFADLARRALADDQGQTILVDKAHYLPADYAPRDLVRLDGVRPRLALNKGNVALELRRIALPALQAMVAAAKRDGVVLDISSAYRSYAYQEKLFARYVKSDGQAAAERYSAHAGASQHQLGLAIDFGSVTADFAATAAGKWLAAHAREFGFTISYPEGQEAKTGYMYEPWHYRYVGAAAAELQYRFFAGSQQDALAFLHDHGERLFGRPAAKP